MSRPLHPHRGWWSPHKSRCALYVYYGDNFTIECPTGSGNWMNLFDVAKEIANRLTRIFLRDESGRRPVYGGTEKFQTDPYWKDCILFYEYFHGDNGAGLGGEPPDRLDRLDRQIDRSLRRLDGAQFLAVGKRAAFMNEESAR